MTSGQPLTHLSMLCFPSVLFLCIQHPSNISLLNFIGLVLYTAKKGNRFWLPLQCILCPTNHCCDTYFTVFTAWTGACKNKLHPTIPCKAKEILHWQVKEPKKAKKGKMCNSEYREQNGKVRNTKRTGLAILSLQAGQISTWKQKPSKKAKEPTLQLCVKK